MLDLFRQVLLVETISSGPFFASWTYFDTLFIVQSIYIIYIQQDCDGSEMWDIVGKSYFLTLKKTLNTFWMGL